jgi:ubiquinone/menaquinone biosynthesis C-methylase UbiE
MTIRGIDISEDMLAVAREELGQSYDRCQIDLGSADSLPHADHSFDLVVCFRFFGLIPLAMARRVLSEIERVSRDKVIIPVPIRKSTAPYLGPLKHDELVQGRLDEQELHALFSEFGFSVVDERLIREREHVLSIVFVLRRSSTANA